MNNYAEFFNSIELSLSGAETENSIQEQLKELVPEKLLEFLDKYVDINSPYTKFLETTTRFNVSTVADRKINALVNFKRINDVRFLNKFFIEVNKKLNDKGIYVGCAVTVDQYRKRILNQYPKVLSYPVYLTHFIVKRVMPKIKITQKLYFALTRGQNRALSLPEILGRLVSCGFTIMTYKEIDGLTYFVVMKNSEPAVGVEPSYGPLFKMRRIGKDGKIIHVYKFRTMHPYAEYLQDYLFKQNSLKEGGKIKDDFRITYWGKIFRKLWIDEIPMFINLFKGEMKFVGVRPLSNQYFNLYSQELQEKRTKVKPGLFPPYYADLPKTLQEIMDSENRYLDAYEKNPVKTDFKYFFKACYNILIKRARSS